MLQAVHGWFSTYERLVKSQKFFSSYLTQEDLSRLGRNYLKTGELIEIVFPEYEVRYIAINDGVDTAREDNEFTPLRNWFNEFYARDTSKKIRAVKQAKAQKGERVNGEVPYRQQYKTAHIVRFIGLLLCDNQNIFMR